MTATSKSPLALPLSDEISDIDFDALARELDAQCAAYAPSLVETFSFLLEGNRYEIRRIGKADEYRYLITTSLGYLPFSIESSERRYAVKAILGTAKSLPRVHFSFDKGGRIKVGGIFDQAQLADPDFMFYPLVQFLQEARPFMRLIKQYL
jgi:hypothetical protein